MKHYSFIFGIVDITTEDIYEFLMYTDSVRGNMAAAKSRKAATSALSKAFAAPPRGFRVKNWNTFAPIDSAVCPMARYPPDELK